MNNDPIIIDFNQEDIVDIELLNDEIINIDINNECCIRNYPELAEKPKINGQVLLGDIQLEQIGVVNDKNYIHNQTEASREWVIIHNLDKYPAVNILNSAGDEVIGDVRYDNTNQITITFTNAFKGKATLN